MWARKPKTADVKEHAKIASADLRARSLVGVTYLTICSSLAYVKMPIWPPAMSWYMGRFRSNRNNACFLSMSVIKCILKNLVVLENITLKRLNIHLKESVLLIPILLFWIWSISAQIQLQSYIEICANMITGHC